MNATKKIAIVMGVTSMATWTLMSGPTVIVQVPVPVVTVQVPAPAVTVTVVAVPDAYVWDGYEYVGVVGGVYFYLGPGNVWLRCEPSRVDRFHDWEKGHADWSKNAIRNEHYRHDAQGHEVPFHDHGHDQNH